MLMLGKGARQAARAATERARGLKVVLFCGGLGMRMREYSEIIPKPMVPLGHRPLLWHSMRYYAHYGHKDFILCLGYRGDVIKSYFLEYKEWLSNDFVFSEGGKSIELMRRDIDDWRITFVNTGRDANIGERLLAVRPHLEGEETFLANYADVLTDAPLPRLLETFHARGKIALFLAARPSQSFHVMAIGDDDLVAGIEPASRANLWVNGGFFVLSRGIFDVMRPGDELVEAPFQRLIGRGQLTAYRHEGFWMGVDTFKERHQLDELYARGAAPWAVWERRPEPSAAQEGEPEASASLATLGAP
jgi:glucose-1-phosphate cytidylyltransferase